MRPNKNLTLVPFNRQTFNHHFIDTGFMSPRKYLGYICHMILNVPIIYPFERFLYEYEYLGRTAFTSEVRANIKISQLTSEVLIELHVPSILTIFHNFQLQISLLII